MQTKPVTFLKLPEYPGGKEQFKEFVKKHLTYPEDALKNKIEGVVFLSAEISGNGLISNIKVEKGIGYGCDDEAVRILGLARFGSVKNRGVRVMSKKRFRVNFKLPKKTESKVKYSLSASDKVTPKSPEKSLTYSYTIHINPQK